MNRFLLVFFATVAFASSAADDKPNVITGQPKIDAPAPSVKTGAAKAAEDAVTGKDKTVPGTAPNLVSTLGPGIPVFEVIPGCAYADQDRPILRYQVENSPDGARTRRITIDAVDDSDVIFGSVLVTPPSPSAGMQTRGTATDSREDWQKTQTAAFLLSATDTKGRRSTRRVEHRYFGHEPLLRYVGERRPPREIRTDRGTTYEYSLKFEVDDIAIRAIQRPTHMILVRDGRSENVELEGVRLAIRRPNGGSTTVRLPSQRFERSTILDLVFRAPVQRYTYYRNRQHDSWQLYLNLAIQHPPGCSADPRNLQVRVPPPGTAPPPLEPTPEPEHRYTGYWYDVTCECREDYGDDPTSETRVFQGRIRTCLASANQAGAGLSCGLATPRFPPAGISGRHPCYAISIPTRSDSGPMSCDATPGNLTIESSNRDE